MPDHKKGELNEYRHLLSRYIDHPFHNTVYIAGPMRGIPDYNFPSFFEAEEEWKKAGYNVINPARIDKDFDEPNDVETNGYQAYKYARRDIAAIFYYCDAVVALPGWERSKGARAEVALARWLGLKVFSRDMVEMHDNDVDLPLGEYKYVQQGNAWVKYEPAVVQVPAEVMAVSPLTFSDCEANYKIMGIDCDDCDDCCTIECEVPACETVLQEAQRLVHGDRGGDYGHPLDDFSRTVGAFNALTGHNLKVEEGPLFMCCVKLSREAFKHKRDNLVDNSGYSECIQQIHEEREKRCQCSSDSSGQDASLCSTSSEGVRSTSLS